MSKFKVGDTVIRIQDSAVRLPIGTTGKVTAVSDCGHIKVDSNPFRYFNYRNFEHYVEQPEQPVLTPQEVFTAILEGVPLEYRTHSGTHWHSLEYPDKTSVSSFTLAEFRKKVQTVTLSGTVPKPVPFDSIEVTDTVYTIHLSTMQVAVVNGRYAQCGGFYWRTQAEAEQARDVLNQCFSTVPVLD